MTPGAYLRMRREAAGVSLVEIAAGFSTQPRLAEHLRAELIELVERDVQPPSFATVELLIAFFDFDRAVLIGLIAGAEPQLCRVCACSEGDPCVTEHGETCSWDAPDLCTACVGKEA